MIFNTTTSKPLIASTAHLSVVHEVVGSTTTAKILMLGDRPRNCQINDNVRIVWGALSTKASKREIIVTHVPHHTDTYLCTNIQSHPSNTAHNTGWFWISDFGFQCRFLVILVVLHVFLCIFFEKKSRKKSQKKATPSTTSAHDLFSMRHPTPTPKPKISIFPKMAVSYGDCVR